MKILFLDIDGVLNSRASTHYWSQVPKDQWPLKKEELLLDLNSVAMLNLLLKNNLDLNIVITSTWRMDFSIHQIKSMFTKFNFLYPERIIDMTGLEFEGRYFEVHVWLRDTDHYVTRYVVIDDKHISQFLPVDVEDELTPQTVNWSFFYINNDDGLTFTAANMIHKMFNQQLEISLQPLVAI